MARNEEKALCRKCLKENDRPGQRWCTKCHAAYMREWNKDHKLSEEQQRRANARALARQAHKSREPCADCGRLGEQRHHEDYSKPLDVIWLCIVCHGKRHGKVRVG